MQILSKTTSAAKLNPLPSKLYPLAMKLIPSTMKDLRTSVVSKFSQCLATLHHYYRVWKERSRQRRALSQLSIYQLKDIGVSRSEAINEASKPFWKE